MKSDTPARRALVYAAFVTLALAVLLIAGIAHFKTWPEPARLDAPFIRSAL